jgi:hypothetical protein
MTNTDQLTSQQVFSTQYTAVMLIILTFVVGSFSQSKAPIVVEVAGTGRIEKAEQSEVASPKTEVPFGTLTIENAFTVDANQLRKDQLDGLVLALKSHDIRALFTIESALGTQAQESSDLLIARMVSTLRWLESIGVPHHAYQLSGSLLSTTGESRLIVEFTKDPSNE